MSDGRTHYADDETIAHIANLEAEIARCKEIAERDGRDYAELSNELTQLRTERDRLRDVLEKIADGQDGTGWRIQSTGYAENVQRLAREALTRDDSE